jgi:hypothetical protein
MTTALALEVWRVGHRLGVVPVPTVATGRCERCGQSDWMLTPEWGHQAVPVCDNPPCVYARTLEASAAVLRRVFLEQKRSA